MAHQRTTASASNTPLMRGRGDPPNLGTRANAPALALALALALMLALVLVTALVLELPLAAHCSLALVLVVAARKKGPGWRTSQAGGWAEGPGLGG